MTRIGLLSGGHVITSLNHFDTVVRDYRNAARSFVVETETGLVLIPVAAVSYIKGERERV